MDQEIKPWAQCALIFPGQGSQHVGMGEQLVKVSKAARDIFQRADGLLGRDLSRLCFEGPAEELESTVNQQPASFVTSIAYLEALRERWADRGIEPHMYAGHSMGEFTAAVAAGSLGFEEGLLLVRERGLLMDQANTEFPGGMASILGLKQDQVVEICAEASKEGYVALATANCEGQYVISGALKPLTLAMELAEKARARKVVRLAITMASHSPLMAKASEGMDELLKKLPMKNPVRPIVGNVSASVLTTKEQVYAELRDQLTHGVLWQKSVEVLQAEGVDLFIECGPSNVLTRLVRRINYDVNSLSLSDEYEGILSNDFQLVEAAAR